MHYLKVETEEFRAYDSRYCVYKCCGFVNDEEQLALFKDIKDAEKYAQWKAIELGVEYRKEKKRKG